MDAYKTISYPRELALGTCFGNVAFGDPTERLILVMHPCSQYPTASTGRLQDALVLGSVPTMDEDPFDLGHRRVHSSAVWLRATGTEAGTHMGSAALLGHGWLLVAAKTPVVLRTVGMPFTTLTPAECGRGSSYTFFDLHRRMFFVRVGIGSSATASAVD